MQGNDWAFLRGQTVLVTGGGGFIGSELCRTCAANGIGKLVIVDNYENNAYAIEQELKRHVPSLPVAVRIANVRDRGRMEEVFSEFRPGVVFHAAAHKHVPLMEENPGEAVKNNVFGTLYCAQLAGQYAAKTFVLISTDKAVDPVSVMGATKRVCEMIIRSMGRRSSGTVFSAVRFGNVWGSYGSVVPLFEQQIAEGGPVTVTDPRITRYFMSVSEAVRLVLTAGAFARSGEIYVLDMGAPVKIVDVARDLIACAGKTGKIDIVFTGLRPGEKLYEEGLPAGLRATAFDKIKIAPSPEWEEEAFCRGLEELRRAAETSPGAIRPALAKIVPEYRYE